MLKVVLMLAGLMLSWSPFVAMAQAPYPPNQMRPYRGGKNCVQIADANGNFNCSPLVTVDPVTGTFSTTGGGGGAQTPILGALVIAPTGNGLTALGNDVVITKQLYTAIAPVGPGVGGLSLRVRPSPDQPGRCRLVAITGNAFGRAQEWPVAFLDPSVPFPANPGNGTTLYGQFSVDLPGGPGGC